MNLRKSQNITELRQPPKNYLQKIDESIKRRKSVLAKLQALKMIDDKQNLAHEQILPKDKSLYDSIKYRKISIEQSPSPTKSKRFHPSNRFNMRYDPQSVEKAIKFYDAIEESSKANTQNGSPIGGKKSYLGFKSKSLLDRSVEKEFTIKIVD